MSLHKAIEHNKEKRDPYKYNTAKRVDPMCRNHGGCKWCEENRKYQQNKESERMKYKD